MAKKGFFSWFRKDKSKSEQETDSQSTQIEQTQTKVDELEPQKKQEQASSAQDQSVVESAPVKHDDLSATLVEIQNNEIKEDITLPNERDITAAIDNASSEVQPIATETQNTPIIQTADEHPVQSQIIEQTEAPIEVIASIEKQTSEPITQSQSTNEQTEEAFAEAGDIDSKEQTSNIDVEPSQDETANKVTEPEPQAKPAQEGFFARLKRGLMRTSENIGSGFIGLFRGKKIDDDLFEELEEQLLIADVGVETTNKLITNLTEHANRKQLKDAEVLYDLLRQEMLQTLEPVDQPLDLNNTDGPFVILMVGVNGVGKTTTIGKLAKQYQRQGKSVMLAAGDTFRAAAVEQLQVWGQRNNIPVIAQHTGADSASVLFDALQAAKARNIDVLIADTAGRLQNKGHLMEELKKVVRVMKKINPNAPHEVMLTLDAGTGQNAISQAQLFQEAVGVSGICISKLDGTARGGVIFAIADKFGIPIRYIGVGEQIDDLRQFNAKDFIDALFSRETIEQNKQ